jgi:multidrug resistance efflux pump
MPVIDSWAMVSAALLAAMLTGVGCGARQAPASPPPETSHGAAVESAMPPRGVRTIGTIAAQRITLVQVPRISGQGGTMTLVKLAPNGSLVHHGELLAEFDSTAQVKSQRDAQARFDDLSHQVEQKRAEDRSNAARRATDLAQANADLEKAKLEIRKGPVLSDLDQLKNAEKLRDAEEHVKSLLRSGRFHDAAERAEVGVLVLQRGRQELTLAHLQGDLDKLTVKAPIDGMVSLENVWKNGSMGHAQEGDQLWAGNPLLRIFDPASMVLQLSVNEADGAILQPGSTAVVHLDAYPSLTFRARFDSASPVAASALGSPLKTFTARYLLDSKDPHLLPDLTAAADILPPEAGAK